MNEVNRWQVPACCTGQRVGGWVPCDHQTEMVPVVSVVLASDFDRCNEARVKAEAALARVCGVVAYNNDGVLVEIGAIKRAIDGSDGERA